MHGTIIPKSAPERQETFQTNIRRAETNGTRFVFIENAARNFRKLSKPALGVSIYVLTHCYGNAEFDISVRKCADFLGIQQQEVRRGLANLVEHGLLERLPHRTGPNGRNLSARFRWGGWVQAVPTISEERKQEEKIVSVKASKHADSIKERSGRERKQTRKQERGAHRNLKLPLLTVVASNDQRSWSTSQMIDQKLTRTRDSRHAGVRLIHDGDSKRKTSKC